MVYYGLARSSQSVPSIDHGPGSMSVLIGYTSLVEVVMAAVVVLPG
jgi:hypothetical protein